MPYTNSGTPAPMPGYSNNINNMGGTGTNNFQNDQNSGNRRRATSTATLNELPLMVQYAVQVLIVFLGAFLNSLVFRCG